MPTPSAIEIRVVAVEQIIDLRHRILRKGLPVESAHFAGDHDSSAIHLAAMRGGQVVGCATLHKNSHEGKPAYQLRGMAVATDRQRTGIGRMLLTEAHLQVERAGVEVIWGNCRSPAAPFYKKFGWRIISHEFMIETAGPHFKMVKFMRD